MIKIIQVGYGSDGQGGSEKGGYTYVVNGNFSKGDVVFPAVKHYRSGKIFGTVGKVLNTPEKAIDKFKLYDKEGNAYELKSIEKGRALGVMTARDESGQFIADRSVKNEIKGEFEWSKRDTAIMGGNVLKAQQQEQARGGLGELSENAQSAVESYGNYTQTQQKGGK